MAVVAYDAAQFDRIRTEQERSHLELFLYLGFRLFEYKLRIIGEAGREGFVRACPRREPCRKFEFPVLELIKLDKEIMLFRPFQLVKRTGGTIQLHGVQLVVKIAHIQILVQLQFDVLRQGSSLLVESDKRNPSLKLGAV